MEPVGLSSPMLLLPSPLDGRRGAAADDAAAWDDAT